jgi:hypothetical protein
LAAAVRLCKQNQALPVPAAAADPITNGART